MRYVTLRWSDNRYAHAIQSDPGDGGMYYGLTACKLIWWDIDAVVDAEEAKSRGLCPRCAKQAKAQGVLL